MNRWSTQCFSHRSYLATTDTPESSDSGLAVLLDSSRQDPPSPLPPPPPTEEPQSHILSSLRLENQMLRCEVASLNQEMASVIQRAKDLQDGKRWDEQERRWPTFLPPSLWLIKWFFYSCRIEPGSSTGRQMELGAVSDRPDGAGTSVKGWWLNRSPLRQRRSACSPENQARWSRSDADVPLCCVRRGTDGTVKVRFYNNLFKVDIRFSSFWDIFRIILIISFLELCKTKPRGAACSPKLLTQYKSGWGRLIWHSGGSRTATGRCRCTGCFSSSFTYQG